MMHITRPRSASIEVMRLPCAVTAADAAIAPGMEDVLVDMANLVRMIGKTTPLDAHQATTGPGERAGRAVEWISAWAG
jgi:hypothetical protein